ncbi:unnamed protein product [Vitrella brassicaformis CCMP3155]|uniref:Acid phosphatase n=2 Tax=Vitrella brassicaformis TaxID=1169539 RepID=A0A0G4FNF1_VITBC|nr:unnamed protein product [Vitrella brassicaformis CCMP3155]|eukprot:CEM15780.1 unnamed protein product [Vitrella brassicaformis CCMP3155]
MPSPAIAFILSSCFVLTHARWATDGTASSLLPALIRASSGNRTAPVGDAERGCHRSDPECKEKLIFVVEVCRHGNRSPYHYFEKDTKNGLDTWEGVAEKGWLTRLGMLQHYLIGAIARKKYVRTYRLLSGRYTPREVYVRSTLVPRRLFPPGSGHHFTMAQEDMRDALYRETGKISPIRQHLSLHSNGTVGEDDPTETIQKMGDAASLDIKQVVGSGCSPLPQAFDMVPVYTVEKEEDTLLLGFEDDICDQFKDEYMATHKCTAFHSPMMARHEAVLEGHVKGAQKSNSASCGKTSTQVMEHFKGILDRADKALGKSLFEPGKAVNADIHVASHMADAVVCQIADGRRPAIKDADVIKGLIDLLDAYFSIRFADPVIASHGSAEFYKLLASLFESKAALAKDPTSALALRTGREALKGAPGLAEAANVWETLRFLYLSAHDSTVAAFIAALGVFNGVQPHFASTIFFELWQKGPSGDFFVRVIYNGDAMGVCGEGIQDCPLTQFLDKIRKIGGGMKVNEFCLQPPPSPQQT